MPSNSFLYAIIAMYQFRNYSTMRNAAHLPKGNGCTKTKLACGVLHTTSNVVHQKNQIIKKRKSERLRKRETIIFCLKHSLHTTTLISPLIRIVFPRPTIQVHVEKIYFSLNRTFGIGRTSSRGVRTNKPLIIFHTSCQ